MLRRILIEEFHLSVLVPHNLSDADSEAVRQTLSDAAFEARLRREIRRVFHREAALSKAKVRLSR